MYSFFVILVIKRRFGCRVGFYIYVFSLMKLIGNICIFYFRVREVFNFSNNVYYIESVYLFFLKVIWDVKKGILYFNNFFLIYIFWRLN